MIVDANLLLYAVDETSPHHDVARTWWEATLNGQTRVGLPWQTVGAFLRIVTHPRVMAAPLSGPRAAEIVQEWLALDIVWVPPAGAATARILLDLLAAHGITGNLVPDAQLASLAIEHGVAVASADADFARWPQVRWVNPLADRLAH